MQSLGKNEEEANDFAEKAVSKFNEASDILHGTLPNPATEKESLKFVREIFSIIESLYSEQRRV